MEYNLDNFKRGLDELGIVLDEVQLGQFLTYYELLVEKNKVMNLTAITEFQEVVEKHFLDSLSLVKGAEIFRSEFEGKIFQRLAFSEQSSSVEKPRLLDLGTGAGFPGIPLKIAFPWLDIVLMDSLNKRILFLQEVIEKLGLQEICAVHGRAEEMARKKEYREKFDICVSRAVANLASLSEYCIPFVKMGGFFVSYKSGEIEEELCQSQKAVKLLGGAARDVVKFQLPNTDMGRSLVIVEKKNATPKNYPRKAGMPSREPLK